MCENFFSDNFERIVLFNWISDMLLSEGRNELQTIEEEFE